jgi:Methylase involved in ubiquinone/menaquinone biosynthesis
MIVSILNLEKSLKVLDCGCGSGLGLEILHKADQSLQLFGNDFSKSMVFKAKSKNLENTEVFLADSLNLPFPALFFDRIVANFSLHVVSNQRKMISEVFRVLNFEGFAVFSYPIYKDDNDLLLILKKTLRKIKIGEKRFDSNK